MVSTRAKHLLNEINNQLNAQNPNYEAEAEEEVLEQEENTLQNSRKNNALMAKYKHQQQQHQNERVDNDKKRVRDAQKVLGPKVYAAYTRGREQRVYGS